MVQGSSPPLPQETRTVTGKESPSPAPAAAGGGRTAAAEGLPSLTAHGLPDLSDEEFRLISNLVHQRLGIKLTEKKRSLVVGRLHKLLANSGYRSFKEYYQAITTDRTNRGLLELISRITTSYSYFYREKEHFEFFQKSFLPHLADRLRHLRSNDIRIWTAGCATGEEPYMLAMLMLDFFGEAYRHWDAGVLATDISDRALTVARNGVYSHQQIEKIPAVLRLKYLEKTEDNQYRIKERVRKEVTFRRFNLLHPFPFKKPFHAIFCRNVMIYFDAQTRRSVIRKFHQFLEPGGFLFIGHSETLESERHLFRPVMPAAYQKR